MNKDRSTAIALEARALNETIDKDKYGMPSLENLKELFAKKIDLKESEVLYSIGFDIRVRKSSI